MEGSEGLIPSILIFEMQDLA